MSQHHARVEWRLGDGDFPARRYDRAHTIVFDGLTVPGTPSPKVVPAPFSHADAMDPEAAFTASLSACHMLWFLDYASRDGFIVTSYSDAAEGTLGRAADGRIAMTKVVLRPRLAFAGDPPDEARLRDLHHRAHEACFIANSVTTQIVVEPEITSPEASPKT